MGRVYYKELPLFHLYDSNLTGSQKLLMTLLLVDRYDNYELSFLARMCPEDRRQQFARQQVRQRAAECLQQCRCFCLLRVLLHGQPSPLH